MPRRASLEFIPCAETAKAQLKFGGEPFGLTPNRWPKSRSAAEPMQFICQVPFGPDSFQGVAESMAYLFIAAEPDAASWDPDGGDNAVVVIPVNQLTNSLTVGDAPRLGRKVKPAWWKRAFIEPCIYTAKLNWTEEPAYIPENTLSDLPEDQLDAYSAAISGNKLGGSPLFLQSEELPYAVPWHLLLQLDSTTTPFWLNFGDAGIGHVFLNSAGTEGKFLWQCC